MSPCFWYSTTFVVGGGVLDAPFPYLDIRGASRAPPPGGLCDALVVAPYDYNVPAISVRNRSATALSVMAIKAVSSPARVPTSPG